VICGFEMSGWPAFGLASGAPRPLIVGAFELAELFTSPVGSLAFTPGWYGPSHELHFLKSAVVLASVP
jgi:hypothetical protein